MRFPKLFVLLASSVLMFSACNKGDAPAGDNAAATSGSADKLDRATLEDGKSYTHNLSFWAKNRGLVGDDIVDNVHFDDGAKNKVVFTYDAALGDKLGKLEQGKVYKATFTFKKSDDALLFGTLTAVE